MRSLNCTWDKLGNLKTRFGTLITATDTFTYDTLNRLTRAVTTAPSYSPTVNVAYNAIGNITSKSDTGTYTYGTTDTCGAAGPMRQCRLVASWMGDVGQHEATDLGIVDAAAHVHEADPLLALRMPTQIRAVELVVV